MDTEKQIVAAVDAWLDAAARTDATSAHLLASWEKVTLLLWRRASLTLGEVTLSVIFERVSIEVSGRNAIAKHIRLGESGPDLRRLRADGASADPASIRAAMRDFVITYISLLDALTAGILTPALRKELEKAVST